MSNYTIWCYSIVYCTILHFIIWYVWFYIVLYWILFCCTSYCIVIAIVIAIVTVAYCSVLYYIILNYILYCIILNDIELNYIILYCVILSYIILCWKMLYHPKLHSNWTCMITTHYKYTSLYWHHDHDSSQASQHKPHPRYNKKALRHNSPPPGTSCAQLDLSALKML